MFSFTAGVTKACPVIETLVITTFQSVFAIQLQREEWRNDIITTDSMC